MPLSKKWTPARRKAFLAHLRTTGNVSAAAGAAGMSRSGAYALRQRDAVFREHWHDALEGMLDDLEEVLLRRALDGVEKPVFYAGKTVGSVRSYNDALGMFLLRGRRGHVFGDKDQDENRQALLGAAAQTGQDARRLIEERLKQLAQKRQTRPGGDDPSR